jgi:hypothetical protein
VNTFEQTSIWQIAYLRNFRVLIAITSCLSVPGRVRRNGTLLWKDERALAAHLDTRVEIVSLLRSIGRYSGHLTKLECEPLLLSILSIRSEKVEIE